MAVERDPYTGQNTTGHEWNGIKELDTPIPKPVIWFYVLTIIFSIAFWFLYPAWPYFSDFTRGLLEYSSRQDVLNRVEKAEHKKLEFNSELISGDLEELVGNTILRARYEKSASILFQDNCAACHGKDLQGQTGFPNLKDSHWLWSGDIGEIETTIKYGINSGHEDERSAEMPAFGRDQMLSKEDVSHVVEHVLAISGQKHDAEKSKKGETVFAENCMACHGDGGKGGLENGAPDLTDKAWIYGSSRREIYHTLWNGRKGVMPAWSKRLSEPDIRKLSLYLIWNGHAESK